ncbi:glycosyl hydrolase 108 family protein [Devosia sp.]|uniref:glycoside hydrolase family 108 protein n=1 Tax=Devosia sp. TaxID=1871048 RepID=UPI001B253479|nr:glycosyl hydrolase 108 family protein [Devosia sp.]MBO9589519.1 glycoside hydrolase family 108 protein [Devosia sp.]
MAKGNFQPALKNVLVHEGGFTDDPRDPGNWTGGKRGVGVLKGTKKGISAAAFPHLDIKALNDNQIADIYHGKYWVPIRGDELPAGVDLSTWDYGVNSGVSRSAKDLQRVLGVNVDGRIGPATILAAKAANPRVVIKGHCAKRLGFLQSLAIWQTYKSGWARRVAGVEAKALSWVSTKAQLEQDAKDAAGKAVSQGVGAGGTVSVGTADQVNGLSGLPIGFVIAGVVIVAGIFIIRTVINAQRAQALSAVAKEA